MRLLLALLLLISGYLVSSGQCNDSLNRKHYVLSAQYNAGIDEILFRPAFGDQNLRYVPAYWERHPFQMELFAGISYPLPKAHDDCLNSEWLDIGIAYQPTFWGTVAQSYEQRYNLDTVSFQGYIRITDSITYTTWQANQTWHTVMVQSRLHIARQIGPTNDFFMGLRFGLGGTLIPSAQTTLSQSYEIEQRTMDYLTPWTVSILNKGSMETAKRLPTTFHVIGQYALSAGLAHHPVGDNRLGFSFQLVAGTMVANPRDLPLRASGFWGLDASLRYRITAGTN